MNSQPKWYARPVFFVADVNRAIRFYVDMLGFEKAWHEADGTGTVCQVNRGDCEIILCEHPTRRDKGCLYSASDLAREELPELDLTLRSAVSIARRLQDPLAELVKIDPKSIGVGQYQHDVSQVKLKRRLDETVESCVNRVGVELNTASPALLGYVAGIGPTVAQKIVRHRDEHGPFRSRAAVTKVAGLGPKTFVQAAGFLRVRGGEHPLDASAVHPERYALVERIAGDVGVPLGALVGNEAAITRIEPRRYVGGEVGLPTLHDILAELRKPGRDPRQAFEAPPSATTCRPSPT